MKTSIYLDTTIISALFDVRTPERMAQTKEFWRNINDFNVYISELVIDEIKGATQPTQGNMLNIVNNFNVLPIDKKSQELAKIYIENKVFPDKYIDDALHVALSSTNQIGILLSWNFSHLVKLKTRRMVSLINSTYNYNLIEILAPPEL